MPVTDTRTPKRQTIPDANNIPIGEFAQLILRLILDTHLPTETAQSRIKQIGMMSIVHYMHVLGIEVTAENLVKRSGVSRGSLDLVMSPLLERRLIRGEIRRNKIGTGKVLTYHFDQGLFDAINANRLSPDHIGKV